MIKYQELDSFFDTIQAARVGELREIAAKLGAKKVRVTFKEKKETISQKKAEMKMKGGKGKTATADAGATQTASSQEKVSVHIGLDAEFSGSMFPVRPTLQYYKGEKLIEGLVEARMNRKNKMKSETLILEQSKSIGITNAEAAKIDAVLGYFHAGGNLSISNEVKSRTNTVWEYTIVF